MAKVKIKNLCILEGATFRHDFLYVNRDTEVAIDLTGYTGRCQFRATVDAGDPPLAEFTTSNGGIVITEIEGKVTLNIADDQSTAFTFTEGVYDIEIEPPSGETIRLVKGEFTIDPEVTR